LSFEHLPVTDFEGCTRNFETLIPVLAASEEPTTRGRGPGGGGQVAMGTSEVEWTVKGKESAVKEIKTGLSSISVAFAQRVGSPQVVAGPTTTAGGTLSVAAYFITGELAAGTKVAFFWIAYG
jgi:hypothetical protein